MNRKVLVIGLDGATWDLLKPWAEKGILPVLRDLMGKGVYGNLKSTVPPVTVPAWISFATGTNPGKHGCYYFVLPRGSLDEQRLITSREIHGKTFYEVLEESGKRPIIINLPGSYPARIKGPLISSMLTQGDNFVFPTGLIDEIPELRDYRIVPDFSLQREGKIEDYIRDVRKLEEVRVRCAKKLFIRDWDFLFLLFSGTDWIQHQMYDRLVTGEVEIDSGAIGLYRDIDEYIGWFVHNAPEGTNILLMSDHGFAAYKRIFNINRWLHKEGYLKLEPKSKPSVQKRAAEDFPERTAEELLRTRESRRNIELPGFLLNHLESIAWLYPLYKVMSTILRVQIASDVLQPDMSETGAYSPPGPSFGQIYINDRKRFIDGRIDSFEYESLITEIFNKLRQIKDPQTQKPVIKSIWKKEDIYKGTQLDAAPDIVFLPYEYETAFNTSLLNRDIFTSRIENTHSLNGILLAYGPDIKQAHVIENAGICDLAPTILHLCGLPVPGDMDGKVLTELFKWGSEPARREVKYQEVQSSKEGVQDTIRKLRKSGGL